MPALNPAPFRLVATLSVMAVLPLWAQPENEKKAPQTIPELEKAIREVLTTTKTPGAGIAIVSKEQVLWVAGIGKADVASNKDATPDTQFRIGSISKGFVALSILKLVEEGKLSLNDTVHSLVPEIQFQNRWEATDPVRVVHLLEHTTGFDDWSPKDYASNDPKPLTLKEGLDFDPATRVCRWRPGTRFAYCNSGPPIAAYIVEKITGQRFENYVETNFFLPMQMTHASYLLTPYVQANLTKAYHDDGVTTFPYQHDLLRPAGAVNVSPREMANYVRMYLNRGSLDGVNILEPSSIDRMETPTSTWASREGMSYGYGLCNYTEFTARGFVAHGHEGGLPGASAKFCYLPDQGVGYVMMLNSRNNEAIIQINRLLADYVTKDFPAPPLPAVVKIPPELASHYEGVYEPISPRNEITNWDGLFLGLIRISFQGDKLIKRSFYGGSAIDLVAVSDRFYRRIDLPVASLALVPDQGEGTIIQDPGGWTTYHRIPGWLLALEFATGIASLMLMVSAVVFALVWIPRNFFGHMKGTRHLSIRLVPLISIICLGLGVIIYFHPYEGAAAHLTVWSASLFLLTLASALAAILGLLQFFFVPRKEVNAFIWWHSLLVTIANLIVVGYLDYWGIIGIRTWG
jgi:CubicO group peptidase (beta-lactamase class C family)